MKTKTVVLIWILVLVIIAAAAAFFFEKPEQLKLIQTAGQLWFFGGLGLFFALLIKKLKNIPDKKGCFACSIPFAGGVFLLVLTILFAVGIYKTKQLTDCQKFEHELGLERDSVDCNNQVQVFTAIDNYFIGREIPPFNWSAVIKTAAWQADFNYTQFKISLDTYHLAWSQYQIDWASVRDTDTCRKFEQDLGLERNSVNCLDKLQVDAAINWYFAGREIPPHNWAATVKSATWYIDTFNYTQFQTAINEYRRAAEKYRSERFELTSQDIRAYLWQFVLIFGIALTLDILGYIKKPWTFAIQLLLIVAIVALGTLVYLPELGLQPEKWQEKAEVLLVGFLLEVLLGLIIPLLLTVVGLIQDNAAKVFGSLVKISLEGGFIFLVVTVDVITKAVLSGMSIGMAMNSLALGIMSGLTLIQILKWLWSLITTE